MLNEVQKKDPPHDEQAIDAAIDLTALIEFNGGFSMTNIALITPSAACDFNLTTVDRGFMSATPMIGMLAGSYFWGCFADVKGRKYTLVTVLFAQGLFEVISGVISNYYGYCLFKFFNGFALGGQIMILPTFIGEYFASNVRQRIMSTINVARPVGAIMSRVLGWAILPLNISYSGDYFFFRSWNLLVLIYGSLAPLLGFLLLTFPETPKYLASTGDDEELVKTFKRMHWQNTGKPFEDFLGKLTNDGFVDLAMRLDVKQKPCKKYHMSKFEKASEIYKDICGKTMKLLKPPLLKRTIIMLPVLFCLTASHMSLALWFPELFRRFAKFEETHPDETTWICGVATQNASIYRPVVQSCPAEIPTRVYINSLIITLTDLPMCIVVVLLIGRIGPKILLISTAIGAVIATIGLFFAKTSVENIIASAFFDTLTGISIGLSLNIIVDLYPTHMRTMASGLGILMARLGSTSGNLLIGHLIDHHCTSFLGIIMAALFVCVMLAFLIPRRRYHNLI